MIDDPEKARRLARAILADIALYEATNIEGGLRTGTLDDALREPLAEGLSLYDARVSPALRARSRYFDAAVVAMLGERVRGRAWRTGLDRLRAPLAVYPPCASCKAPLGADRIAFHGLVEQRWLLLLGCAACLAVTGASAPMWHDGAPEVFLEAGAPVVTRLRERIARATEQGTLEAEVESIVADPVLSRLLGVPEVSADARPHGVLRLARACDVADGRDWESSAWPGVPPRLVPREREAGVLDAILSVPVINGGTTLDYLARDAGGWRLAGPRPGPLSEHWAGLRSLIAARELVRLEEA